MTPHEVHHLRRAAAAQWLARLGYATTAQVGALVYGSTSDTHRRMASRLLASMNDDRLLLTAKHEGKPLWALNQRGARLAAGVIGLDDLKSFKSVLRYVSHHRVACNEVVARASCAPGFVAAVTEYEIQLSAQHDGQRSWSLAAKVPDVLLSFKVDEGLAADYFGENAWWWVEVENSKRGGRDLNTLADWCIAVFERVDAYDFRSLQRQSVGGLLLVVSRAEARTIRERLLRLIEAKTDPDFAESVARFIRQTTLDSVDTVLTKGFIA